MQRLAFLCLVLGMAAAATGAAQCKATPGEQVDPDYSPSAPHRDNVGSGFVLSGTIRGDDDCQPIGGATVEFWLAGPRGYTSALRGTVVADRNGHYRFQSPFPADSGGPAPHIHLVFSADGFVPILTEIFPSKEKPNNTLDIVLALGD